jgi:threonine aldolase
MPDRKKPDIDTRGEFLLKPTDAMWEAMRSADIGWPSWGEDPYVNRLQELAAQLTGKEAALLCPTTNVANLLAMMGFCSRGDVALMEERCHLWWVEERNIAAHAAAAPRLIRGNKFGEMAIADIEAAFTDCPYGFRPRTPLVCLENTHNVAGGIALSLDYLTQVAQVAHNHDAALFVDGARFFNAAVAHGLSLSELAAPVDALSLSLNKGIGAPYGSMLCGSAALIEGAKDNHRMLGSHSIHKEGIFAAAAIVALETMIPRLAEDHARARRLAELLSTMEGISVDMETVQTNIVRVEINCMTPAEFTERVLGKGVGVSVLDAGAVKFITHHGLGDDDIDAAAAIVGDLLEA